jgi:predicted phage terminase large subunit-like protein
MQRLHEHDLCGYLQEIEPGEWFVLSLPCIYTDSEGNEKALWEHKHTLEELRKIEKANSYVFQTQYMQDPKPIEGLMYADFRTYDAIPTTQKAIRKNYTDTADTGEDYLCSICYIETELGNYVTDVLYTSRPMEYTEPKTAEMLTKHQTQKAVIESNNGGRSFARAVESQCRLLGNNITKITWFHQGENKQVRIFTKSNEVQNMTFFPSDWNRRWPEFYSALTSYRKEGRNSYDDAPDALTGTIEHRDKVAIKSMDGIFY